MAKTREYPSLPETEVVCLTTEPLLDKTIETLYPLFQEWVRKIKGWATVDGISLIKAWYEFLEWGKLK